MNSKIRITFLLYLLSTVLLGCGKSSGQNSTDMPDIDYVNAVDSSHSAFIPDADLADKVRRFRAGETSLAYPLMSTYRDKGDEVSASIYARSIAIQEKDPTELAMQAIKLKTLAKSTSVCDAMRLNLEVWSKLPNEPVYDYAQSRVDYEKKCL
jgi:hypothetical protein